MRNAEYQAAKGQCEVACLSCCSIRPRDHYRSRLNRPGASICKQHSAFRTPHSAFPNRSIHGRPSGCSERGAARSRPCAGNECGVRNAQCGIPSCKGQCEVACLSCCSITRAHNYRSCLNRPIASICKQHSAFRMSLIVRSTADHPGTPSVEPPGRGPVLGTNAECGMRKCQNAEYRTARG